MSELLYEWPRKLPFAATFVVWASSVLTLTHQVVWYHMWALDRCICTAKDGPDCVCTHRRDRCYAGAKGLAARIRSLSIRTIEDARSDLLRMCMGVSFERDDGPNRGYVMLLPIRQVVGERLAGGAAERLAGELDLYLTDREAWRRRRAELEAVAARRRDTPPDVGELRVEA